MIDLTTDKQDNSGFVTSVELNDDLNTYTITYADGHKEEKPFDSIHNFNADVYKMETQYYRYQDSFKKEMNNWYLDSLKKTLIELISAFAGIILTVNFVPEGIIKTLMILLTILFTIGFLLFKVRDFTTISYATLYLEDVRKFISVQEGLKVPVKDPKNGKDDDWYLANLSSINLGTDVSLYEKLAVALHDDELKEEEGKRLTKVLKGE